MQLVEMIRDRRGRKAGSRFETSPAAAEILVRRGYAKLVKSGEKQSTESPEPKRKAKK
jgi:hypothetical protein